MATTWLTSLYRRRRCQFDQRPPESNVALLNIQSLPGKIVLSRPIGVLTNYNCEFTPPSHLGVLWAGIRPSSATKDFSPILCFGNSRVLYRLSATLP